MSNRMFIYQQKNTCVIKRFKDQVNISEPLYRMTQDLPVQFNSICGSPKHGDTTANLFAFSRGQNCLSLFKK
jgi:hypothetical protein